MCELMGYSFAKPIVADFSIREFGQRGEDNADGWGLAWYPDQSLAVIKEAGKWKSSLHSGFLETYAALRSQIFIAHVRHLTVGQPARANTHPFSRELGGIEITEKMPAIRQQQVHGAAAVVLGQVLMQSRPAFRVGKRLLPTRKCIQEAAKEVF